MLVLLAFSFASFFKGLLMFVFVLSALLLMLVVLLQEPKGGGLSSAFGGVGAETFGVQTGSVNRFTAYVAGAFMVTALIYAGIRPDEESTLTDTTRGAEEEPTPPGGAIAEPNGQKPAGNKDEDEKSGGAEGEAEKPGGTEGEGGTETPGNEPEEPGEPGDSGDSGG
jgi:preprotein translocase subunit SecG